GPVTSTVLLVSLLAMYVGRLPRCCAALAVTDVCGPVPVVVVPIPGCPCCICCIHGGVNMRRMRSSRSRRSRSRSDSCGPLLLPVVETLKVCPSSSSLQMRSPSDALTHLQV